MSTVYYNVKNRGASTVVYRIPEEGIRRRFAPGEVKQISAEELEKLTYQSSGMTLLTKFLQIQSPEAIKKMGMQVEPEYYMSETDVAKLLTSGSLDAFLDALDFAPVGVIDLIKSMSLSLPLVDIPKRKALKEKTGFDVEAALKHKDEEQEDGQTTILKQNNGERRVQPAAAPAGRRTAPPAVPAATPKYNIISKPAEEVSGSAE